MITTSKTKGNESESYSVTALRQFSGEFYRGRSRRSAARMPPFRRADRDSAGSSERAHPRHVQAHQDGQTRLSAAADGRRGAREPRPGNGPNRC